jgi:hypothetical protein
MSPHLDHYDIFHFALDFTFELDRQSNQQVHVKSIRIIIRFRQGIGALLPSRLSMTSGITSIHSMIDHPTSSAQRT